jgi:transposase
MFTSRNQVVLPLNLRIKLPENDPVKKLVEIMDEMDYTELYKTYLRSWRKIDPAILFEVIVYAYMNNIYSSRGIENACRIDIRFMWLLQDSPVPDHTTITRFQDSKRSPVIEALFYQLAEKLIGLGEVSYRHIFVDGTKIEANANRYSFVWQKTVEKNQRKLRSRIEKDLPEIQKRYGISESASLTESLNGILSFVRLYGITFVNGKGKHKTQLQRDAEKLNEYAERLENYEKELKICGKRKSYSKTDTDATFMRMKEDHMNNGQLKPGYNVQIGVESEYIIGIGLFPNPTDTTTLIPFLERVQSRSGRIIKKIIADAGYSSEENYTYLENNGQEAYIKPNDYEVRKTKRYKNDIYRVENMPYDEEADSFLCPNGKKLNHIYDSKRKSYNGYTVTTKNYVCESCAGCPHREKCFKGKYDNRQICISQTYARQKREAEERITTDEGNLLRMNRTIQVEGAFGVLKQDYAFRRFLMRGKHKAETQFILLAMAFNVQKLCNRIKFGRFNKSLFEKQPDKLIS